jgi:polyisoprenoid-binding protein YceI
MPKFRIDPDRSQVWIDARSTLHPIHSTTTGLQGSLDVDLRDDGQLDLSRPAAGHLELPVDKLSSGNDLYDREMRRRIDARRFPKINGDLEALEACVGEMKRYKVRGELTFHGVTHTYEHEMVITAVDDRTLQLAGEKVFDIRDFEVTPPRILMIKVHPDVSVRVSIVAVRDVPELPGL